MQEDPALVATKGPHAPAIFDLDSLPCTIGRATNNSLCLADDPAVSSSHCELFMDGGRYVIRDLDSTNGTYVNGVRIHAPTQIVPKKSTIHLGKTQLLFIAGDKTDDSETIQTMAFGNIVSAGSILMPSSNFFRNQQKEETLLVVDLCNSTALASEHGEALLLKVLYVMSKIMVRHAEEHEVQFLKCTGDGFFGTFKRTEQALRVACRLLDGAEYLHLKVPQVSRSSLRIAIHRGEVTVDEKGDRLGLACHLVFRIEGAKLDTGLHKGTPIFLSDEAVYSLHKNCRCLFTPLGKFAFKGFEQPVSVNGFVGDTNVLMGKME